MKDVSVTAQRSIASFFGKGAEKAATAKPKEEEREGDQEMADANAPAVEGTPSKQVLKKSESPPTRKRLRQLEESDEEEGGDGGSAAPKESSEMKEESGAAGAEGKKEEDEGKEVAAPSPSKAPKAAGEAKKEPVKKAGDDKKEKQSAVASLFAPKKAKTDEVGKSDGAGKGHKRSKEEEEEQPKAAPAAAKKDAPAAAKAPKEEADAKGSSSSAKGDEASKKKADAGGGGDASGDEGGEGDDGLDDESHKMVMSLAGSDFDASKEATWKKGEPVPYAHLAQAFEKIEGTSKRLEITAILTRALRTVIETTPGDLLSTVYMCVNKLAPAHEGIELGLGEMVLKKALAEATGRQEKDIKADYEKVGDLGIVAMKSRSTQRTMFAAKALTVQSVFKSLLSIAKMEGNKSGQLKKDKIKSMLVASKGIEAQYVIRHLQGKMRIGLAEQTVLVALAHAVALSPPALDGKSPKSRVPKKEELDRAVDIIKEVFCQLPCYDKIIPRLLERPIEELPEHCFLTPGIPIKPMLAHPTKGISEVLDRFANQNFTCEYKYDGERGQIHKLPDGTVKIYSRNSEDNTSKYPDIINMLPEVMAEGTTDFVLDCEVVAYDRETKKILPFQVLSTRKRKEADEGEIKVQVCLFAFDMLYFNGEALIKKPLKERREQMRKSFNEVEGTFMFATCRDASDTEEILAFLNESVAASCEGLMVKTLDAGGPGSTYEPDKRSHKWLKVKKDYIKGMTDSFDLVPIGAFYGKGKRTGVYGAYLLACYNADTEDYETICKIGTGFSDEQLKTFYDELSPHVIPGPKSYYQWEQIPKDTPDVWLDARTVWEVSAADLSISPVHKAAVGLVDDAKGIALRFPRLVRVRDDKTPENATSSTQVAQMYQNQAVIGGEGGANYDD